MTKRPNFEIKWLSPHDIYPYEKNVKNHPEDEVKALAASIKKFGWDQPIVVDGDMVIIKGHGRRLAALSLGLDKVPVLIRADLTKIEAEAARISDNHVVGKSIDHEMLREIMRDINGQGSAELLDEVFSQKEIDFLTTDSMEELNEDAFVDDIGDALLEQEEEDRETVERLDEKFIPIAKALGFKTVPGAWERDFQSFMTRIETDTGKKGGEAFHSFVVAVLAP